MHPAEKYFTYFKKKKKSEDNGVSLYSLQQQLSSLKTSLESLQNNYSRVTEFSLKEKGQIRSRKQNYANMKKESDDESTDLLIDNIHRQVRTLESEIEESEAKLGIRSNQSSEADEILKETHISLKKKVINELAIENEIYEPYTFYFY